MRGPPGRRPRSRAYLPAPQHRHHRARRPWQDHAGRPAPEAVRHVRRPQDRARTRHGLQRARARTRHHDPGEEHCDPVARLPHQHRRYAGPRRLRRRGRARAVDGRLGAAAGRCGRRADAADALRDAEGVRARAAADRRDQQDRPRRSAPALGARPDVRPVRQARRERSAARLPGRLRLGAAGLRRPRAEAAGRRHDAAVRSHRQALPAAGRRRKRRAAAAGQPARLLELRRARSASAASSAARSAATARSPSWIAKARCATSASCR